MTQNKYTNWNVVAVVVHVYKENKKICENWSQNFDDEDDFFFTVHKNPEWYFDLDFLQKDKAKIFWWWFYTATWCGASSGLGPGGGCGGPLGADAGVVDIADVGGVAADGGGGTSAAPSTQLFNFFAEGSVVLSSNVATSPAASMGLLVGCTAAVGGDKFFRSVVLSFSLEFWNVNINCKQSSTTKY